MMRRLPLVPLIVSALSLAAVIWWASRQDRPQIPHGPSALLAVLAAIGVSALATLVRAERWHRILLHNSIPAGRADSYGLTPVGYMGNNVLPARAGELLRMFLLAPRVGKSKREVLASIVAERLLDVLALGLIFMLLAGAVVRSADVPARGLVFLAVLIVIGIGVAALALSARLGARLLSERLHGTLATLTGPAKRLVSLHGLGLLAMSALIWSLEAGVYVAVGQASGLDLGPIDALYVVALTNLFALVPAAPGYVGTFDAAVIFAIDALGAVGATAVSYLLLLRFVLFVPITIVGLVLLVTRYGGLAVYRAARLEGMRA